MQAHVSKTETVYVTCDVQHLDSKSTENERPVSQGSAALRRTINAVNTADSQCAPEAPTKSHVHRRSWRRSRINIPDRTSSLCQRPKTTRPRSKPRLQQKTRRVDSISLHNRSCKLFSSIDEILALNRESPPPRYSEAVSRPGTRQNSVTKTGSSHVAAMSCAPTEIRNLSVALEPAKPPSNESQICDTNQSSSIRPPFNTVMSWTSNESRRREYAKIDRAYTGLRGWFNQIIPKAWRRCGRRDFFRGECDGDSVRRFRVTT